MSILGNRSPGTYVCTKRASSVPFFGRKPPRLAGEGCSVDGLNPGFLQVFDNVYFSETDASPDFDEREIPPLQASHGHLRYLQQLCNVFDSQELYRGILFVAAHGTYLLVFIL